MLTDSAGIATATTATITRLRCSVRRVMGRAKSQLWILWDAAKVGAKLAKIAIACEKRSCRKRIVEGFGYFEVSVALTGYSLLYSLKLRRILELSS